MKVRTLLTQYPYKDADAISRYMINLGLATRTEITQPHLAGDWIELPDLADSRVTYLHQLGELKTSLDAVGLKTRILMEVGF